MKGDDIDWPYVFVMGAAAALLLSMIGGAAFHAWQDDRAAEEQCRIDGGVHVRFGGCAEPRPTPNATPALRTSSSAASRSRPAPQRVTSATPTASRPTSRKTLGVADTLDWTALARCESGGDPTAVSPSGRYRGAFQFDRRTWAAYGPAGDPAAAPYAEQLRRARALHADRGAAPWPVCGKRL